MAYLKGTQLVMAELGFPPVDLSMQSLRTSVSLSLGKRSQPYKTSVNLETQSGPSRFLEWTHNDQQNHLCNETTDNFGLFHNLHK